MVFQLPNAFDIACYFEDHLFFYFENGILLNAIYCFAQKIINFEILNYHFSNLDIQILNFFNLYEYEILAIFN